MALTSVDRTLLQRCLQHDTGAWNDFVDRFLGLIYHVSTTPPTFAAPRSLPEQVEDIAQEVLLQVVANDYAVLKQFRGRSSLATYLTVIARRICVHQLAKLAPAHKPLPAEMKKTRGGRARRGPASAWSGRRRCSNSSAGCRRRSGRSCGSSTWRGGRTRRSAPP